MISKVTQLRPPHETDELVCEVTEDDSPLIEPGQYEAVFRNHNIGSVFNTPKIIMWLEIVTLGPALGLALPRYYRAKSVKRRKNSNGGWSYPKKGGAFTMSKKSDFLRDYVRLIGPLKRYDRLSLAPFKRRVLRIKIRTVCRDYKGNPIPESLRYSIIDELVEFVTNGGEA
jgi:hypothetical protein